MYKILVIITCIVILTIHWNDFTDKVNLTKILSVGKNVTTNIMEEGSRAVEDAVNALSDTSRQDDARMAEAARVTLRRLIRSRLGKNAIVEARIIRVE